MLFSPGTVVANDLPQQEAASTQTQVQDPGPDTQKTSETPATPATPAAPIDAKAVMEAITADREAREARAKADQERDTYKTRAEAAETKLAEIEKAKKNRLLDPAGFLRKLGYTDRELALTSEGIMFSLMPDKAPPDHRAKLVEAEMNRFRDEQEQNEKQKVEDARKRETEAVSLNEKQLETRYTGILSDGAKSFKAGEFPTSQTWFADDHAAYTAELFSTARAVALEAQKTGSKVDLSPAAIASHVEKKLAERVKKLSGLPTVAPQQAPAYSQTQVQGQSAPTPATQAETKTPAQPRRLTDKEIIERATKAAFGL